MLRESTGVGVRMLQEALDEEGKRYGERRESQLEEPTYQLTYQRGDLLGEALKRAPITRESRSEL